MVVSAGIDRKEQQIPKDQAEPIWKGFLSWQVGLALLAVGGYFLTIVYPDKVPSIGPSQSDRSVTDLNLLSESVLDDFYKTEAGKLVAAGRYDDAVVQAEKAVK